MVRAGVLVILGAVLLIAVAAAFAVPFQPEFKTITTAVCEENSSYIYCHDEVKVVCGENEYILPRTESQVACGSLKMDIPQITGAAVFAKDWKDPRLL